MAPVPFGMAGPVGGKLAFYRFSVGKWGGQALETPALFLLSPPRYKIDG
jgi:hypothetical protein